MPGNHLVVGANGRSSPGQFSAQLTSMCRCLPIVFKDFQASRKTFDVGQISFRFCGLFCSVDHFHERDCADAHLPMMSFENLTHRLWSIFDGEDADIGIEHELEHQKASRS